jgi:tetratricopeptide (TPR) repeat protein
MDLEMESCKNIFEKIIFFEDLSKREQQEVNKHTKDCTQCQKHLEEIQAILFALKRNQKPHAIDEELLLRYSIHLSAPAEPDYDGMILTRSEITRITQHLAECDFCQKKVDQLCREYQEIEEYLEKTGLPQISFATEYPLIIRAKGALNFLKSAKQMIKNKIFVPMPNFHLVAAGAVAVIALIIWVGPFFRGSDNPYHHLASLEHEKVSFLTRSGISKPIDMGVVAFYEGDYQKAIGDLEPFLSKNPSDSSLLYIHYILGISYLFEAKSELLGRFERIDTKMVDKGIQHLRITLKLTNNFGIQEACKWYIGKAYLMKGEGKKAREIFETVMSMKGRRYRDAKAIIKDLDIILSSH